MERYFLLTILLFVSLFTNAQTGSGQSHPYEVVVAFIKALGDRQFAAAYQQCSGAKWGTLKQFSSIGMYGGITGSDIISIDSVRNGSAADAIVKATSNMEDPVNGNGTFTQHFSLKRQANNQWKIVGIKLISSSRAQDNWNLKLPMQKDLTLQDVQRLTKTVYDTLKSNLPPDRQGNIERSVKTLVFYKTDKDTFAIAVADNKDMTGCGSCIGWCDVIAFQKINASWKMTDFLSGAGGGNLGNPGHFERLLRVGDNMAGIVITGGLFHSGALIFDDIIGCSNGRLISLVSVFTSHEYDGGTYQISEGMDYEFKKNGKPMYDLFIERYDIKGKSRKKTDSAVILYNNGYPLPERFNVDG